MAKIYTVPEEIKVPNFNHETWREDEKKFIKELNEYCILHYAGKYVGKELRIQHADGYARYMVMSEKPFSLIHIPLGDAWDSPLVDGLTVKAIKDLINARESLNKLFGKL